MKLVPFDEFNIRPSNLIQRHMSWNSFTISSDYISNINNRENLLHWKIFLYFHSKATKTKLIC